MKTILAAFCISILIPTVTFAKDDQKPTRKPTAYKSTSDGFNGEFCGIVTDNRMKVELIGDSPGYETVVYVGLVPSGGMGCLCIKGSIYGNDGQHAFGTHPGVDINKDKNVVYAFFSSIQSVRLGSDKECGK